MVARPRVVWAAQAPTLLNILARSDRWDMSVADLGETSTLGELSQLTAPRWDGVPTDVKAVFVCSPHHVSAARDLLPSSEIILVAHQGYSHKLPYCPEARTVVSFSQEVDRFVREDATHRSVLSHIENFAVIRPWYEVLPRWNWAPNDVWMMMSRPWSREAFSIAALESIRSISGARTLVFGQDQPDGMLDDTGKFQRRAISSAYLTALHPRAGFGLAEFEAMAAGCPVIGALWGDLLAYKRQGEDGPWDAFREYGDLYNTADLVDRIAQDSCFANRVSEEQKAFIADRFSLQSMNESIDSFLQVVLAPGALALPRNPSAGASL